MVLVITIENDFHRNHKSSPYRILTHISLFASCRFSGTHARLAV